MNAGAFAVVGDALRAAGEQHLITDLSGWGYRFPLLGVCLTVCMLSLGGIPPTVGFLGKYLVFPHAIQHGHLWLALVGVAASLIGVFYYLRVVYVLYMKEELAPARGPAAGWLGAPRRRGGRRGHAAPGHLAQRPGGLAGGRGRTAALTSRALAVPLVPSNPIAKAAIDPTDALTSTACSRSRPLAPPRLRQCDRAGLAGGRRLRRRRRVSAQHRDRRARLASRRIPLRGPGGCGSRPRQSQGHAGRALCGSRHPLRGGRGRHG